MKKFVYIIGSFCAFSLVTILLAERGKKDLPKVCNPYLAHIEIHADRPLPEAIKESAYERASDEERQEYDRREADRKDIEENGV